MPKVSQQALQRADELVSKIAVLLESVGSRRRHAAGAPGMHVSTGSELASGTVLIGGKAFSTMLLEDAIVRLLSQKCVSLLHDRRCRYVCHFWIGAGVGRCAHRESIGLSAQFFPMK